MFIRIEFGKEFSDTETIYTERFDVRKFISLKPHGFHIRGMTLSSVEVELLQEYTNMMFLNNKKKDRFIIERCIIRDDIDDFSEGGEIHKINK